MSKRTLGFGAAAAAGTVAVVAASGSGSGPSVTPGGTAGGTGGGTGGTGGGTGGGTSGGTGGGTGTPSFAFANGAWRNTLALLQDGCGGFAPSATTTATVTVDTSTGSGQVMHVHPSASLSYAGTTNRTSDTAGTVNGTGTVSFGTSAYRITITLQITGNTVTVTETFDRTSGGTACTARYSGPGTRQ